MKPAIGLLAVLALRRCGAYCRPTIPSAILIHKHNLSTNRQVHDEQLLSIPPSFDAVGFFNDLDFILPPFRGTDITHSINMAMDLRDKKDHYELVTDLPGCEKKEIHLHLHKNRLTISADRHIKDEKKDEGERHIRRERHSHFSRTISVPDSVDKDKIGAHYENGVLTVTMPKLPNSQKELSRTIALK